MSKEQEEFYFAWRNSPDYPDDYWELLDSISFKFSPGWRKRYKEIEHLYNVTN